MTIGLWYPHPSWRLKTSGERPTLRTTAASMANQWRKPAYEEFDVNGECTAYAGAHRAGLVTREARHGGLITASCDSAAPQRPAGGDSSQGLRPARPGSAALRPDAPVCRRNGRAPTIGASMIGPGVSGPIGASRCACVSSGRRPAADSRSGIAIVLTAGRFGWIRAGPRTARRPASRSAPTGGGGSSSAPRRTSGPSLNRFRPSVPVSRCAEAPWKGSCSPGRTSIMCWDCSSCARGTP